MGPSCGCPESGYVYLVTAFTLRKQVLSTEEKWVPEPQEIRFSHLEVSELRIIITLNTKQFQIWQDCHQN